MTRSWRARIMGTLAALVVSAGLLTVTSTPAAAAEQRCNYDGVSYNACLTIEYAGSARWNVHIGFDRYMPGQYAREIIQCGSQMFAEMYGEDGSTDQWLGYVWLRPGYPVASDGSPSGLFAEFFRERMNLDEDRGSDRDEVYGTVHYFDCHDGGWHSYNTGLIVGNFN
jgi:hypothetical protein